MKQLRIASPADVRAELARMRWPLYQFAAAIGMHPTRLGYVLNGGRPMTPALRARIERAIVEEAQRRATAAAG